MKTISRLEAKDNGKVPSILSAFDNRRNSENVYANRKIYTSN